MGKRNNKGQFVKKDIAKQRYGKVVALEPTNKNSQDGSIIWVMRCDCGTIFERPASRFRRSKSCGCLQSNNPGTAKPLDLSEYRKDMATALEPTDKRDKGGYVIWKLRCDCGNIFERPAYALTRETVRSCGCTKFLPKGRPRIPNNGSHVNALFSHYRQSAKNRGIEFFLTKEEARNYFESPCFYCGEPPSISYTHSNLSGEYAWNGIDRVDSRKPYILDNCVPCCKRCNWAKGELSVKEFKSWIARIYKHLFT